MTDVDLNDLRIEHDRAGSRRGLPILAVLVIFLLGGALGFGIREFAPPFQTEEVPQDQPGADVEVPAAGAGTPAELTAPRSFTEGGWIEVPSYHPLMVTSLISGRLDELNVLEGSRVEKGDVIARLYQKDLEDAKERAEAEVAAAAAELELVLCKYPIDPEDRRVHDVQ